jgi:uncharacterized protein YmfQ (DUF2313 family)
MAAMNHNDALNLLFPIEIGGVFAADLLLEGKQLDEAQASAETLLREMYGDTAYDLLAAWERVCALMPEDDAPLQSRRDAVVKKLRELGGLSRAYFIALAASRGWTITIDEFQPFMAGINSAGDMLQEIEVIWIWRVNVSGYAVYSFRSGLSAAGERLTWWIANSELESMFNDLKPAHTAVIFNYS